MNTVRLPRIESRPAGAAIVDADAGAPCRAAKVAANSTQFAVSPFADRPWRASSRRERLACTVAAGVACACTLCMVVGLFASLA
jgi:hypothetical protein